MFMPCLGFRHVSSLETAIDVWSLFFWVFWNPFVTSKAAIWGLDDDDEDDPFPAGLLPMLDEEVPNHDDTAGSSTVPPTGGFGEESLEQFTAIQHLLWELQQETEKDEEWSQWGTSERCMPKGSPTQEMQVSKPAWLRRCEIKILKRKVSLVTWTAVYLMYRTDKKMVCLHQLCRCIPAWTWKS